MLFANFTLHCHYLPNCAKVGTLPAVYIGNNPLDRARGWPKPLKEKV